MSTSRSREQRRANARAQAALDRQRQSRQRKVEKEVANNPRCLVCANVIAAIDLDRTDDGRKIHRMCKERLAMAQEQREIAESVQRVQEAGLWVPGR